VRVVEGVSWKKRRVPDLYAGWAGLVTSYWIASEGPAASQRAPARDARLFSRQRWICPRDVTLTAVHARWRSRRAVVSC
jgi:hypothetical protein